MLGRIKVNGILLSSTQISTDFYDRGTPRPSLAAVANAVSKPVLIIGFVLCASLD